MLKLFILLGVVACAYGASVPLVYAAPGAVVYKTPDKDTSHVAVSNANGNYAYTISEHKTPGAAVVAAAPAVQYVAPAPYYQYAHHPAFVYGYKYQ